VACGCHDNNDDKSQNGDNMETEIFAKCRNIFGNKNSNSNNQGQANAEFYVPSPKATVTVEDAADEEEDVQLRPKSATLKSTASALSAEFNTPPESPGGPNSSLSCSPRAPTTADVLACLGQDALETKPPVPPPRAKRLAASKNLERLKLSDVGKAPPPSPSSPSYLPPSTAGNKSAIARSSSQGDEPKHGVSSLAVPPSPPIPPVEPLRGHLSMLVVSAKGLRQSMKARWFSYDRRRGRLRYYRGEDEGELLGEIDVLAATFNYDVASDKNGEFTIW